MMPTEISPEVAPPEVAAPRRRPPTLVLVAFYLWWPLIIGQSIVLAYLGLTLVQAANVGGPAWDVLFVDPPIAFALAVIIAVEIGFVFSLRGAGRVARVALVVLGVVNTGFAFLVGIPATGTRAAVVQTTAQVLAESVAFDVGLTLKVLAVIALCASILPFTPPANRYFWKAPAAVSTNADSTLQPAEPRPRRRMPWQVLVAFILWWPLILIQALGLVYLGMTVTQYVGTGMGSTVTVLFVVGVGLPLLALVATEIPLVLFLRKGSRVARGWLLCLAIPTALLTIWPTVAVFFGEILAGSDGLGGGDFVATVSAIGAVPGVLALAAAILPFVPPASRFFNAAAEEDAPAPAPDPAEEPTAVDPTEVSGG